MHSINMTFKLQLAMYVKIPKLEYSINEVSPVVTMTLTVKSTFKNYNAGMHFLCFQGLYRVVIGKDASDRKML